MLLFTSGKFRSNNVKRRREGRRERKVTVSFEEERDGGRQEREGEEMEREREGEVK
jgi:hypothetical protein